MCRRRRFCSYDTGWRAVGHNVPKAGLVFQDENVKIEAYRTLHTTWPITYAYRVTTPDKVVTISGDTVKNKGIIEASRGADILVHEVVTIEGQDTAGWANGGKYKIISFYAKKARGLMARWIIQNKVKDFEDFAKFNVDGYKFSKAESTLSTPVFLRKP